MSLPTPGFYLTWTQGTAVLIGKVDLVFQQEEAVAGISFPGQSTIPINIFMASSARDLQTFDTLRNTRLYLTGNAAEIETVQTVWPPLGGGLFISYDGGRSYNLFSTTYGYQSNPSTWPIVPAQSIGLNGQDGVLGPFDSANFILKFVIPPQATQYQIYDISLTADFDVQ
jgi:hypothetical protein